MKYDVVIVGAGMAGLTAAAFLSKEGRKVAVIDRQAKTGGLVQTFFRNGIGYDTGLRSIENSGIVIPMLRQLGIEIEWLPSPVSLGVGNQVIRLSGPESFRDYEALLLSLFPDHQADVKRITSAIRRIMKYMDVLYGIENPAFRNMKEDREYLFKEILPWVFRYMFTVGKINRLKLPVDEYLSTLTSHQPLIDMIAQHFFQKTPASFALSYFHLYLDYRYPKGGTSALGENLEAFIRNHGGEFMLSTTITEIDPIQKQVRDHLGNLIGYNQLVWAGDMKALYSLVPVEKLGETSLANKIGEKRAELAPLRGCDSVLTVYMAVDLPVEWFEKICTGHFFYTPEPSGLSCVSGDTETIEQIKGYLTSYCDLNTYEIAIPAMRDPSLAPPGKTGLVVSLLFDYQLAKRIEESGWSEEIRNFLEEKFIEVLDRSIFPGLAGHVTEKFSSSPLTIEKLTGNTDGAIVGWAFTNPIIPAESKTLQITKSVLTPIPSVYQAGQWVFTPSGLPISILTGKLAADRVCRDAQ